MITARLIQFIRPDGVQVNVTTPLPDDCAPLIQDMEAHGCRLEAEVLNTGLVSITVSDPKEGIDLDCSLTENGPAVKHGIISMLKRKPWLNTPCPICKDPACTGNECSPPDDEP